MISTSAVDIAFPASKSDYLPGEAWFEQNYPVTYRRFGPPVQLVWGANHDTVASCLREGATRLVYHGAEDRFYYWDDGRGAYCPVEPEERILALVRTMLRRASEGMNRTEKVVWFGVWNERAIDGVLDAARALLAVDHTFFHGESAHRRFVDGKLIEPTTVESHQMFAEQIVQRDDDALLTVPEAWEGYWRFCSMHRLPPLRRTTFREKFRGETISRFGIGLRHDLKIGEKTAQGWLGLKLERLANNPIPVVP